MIKKVKINKKKRKFDQIEQNQTKVTQYFNSNQPRKRVKVNNILINNSPIKHSLNQQQDIFNQNQNDNNGNIQIEQQQQSIQQQQNIILNTNSLNQDNDSGEDDDLKSGQIENEKQFNNNNGKIEIELKNNEPLSNEYKRKICDNAYIKQDNIFKTGDIKHYLIQYVCKECMHDNEHKYNGLKGKDKKIIQEKYSTAIKYEKNVEMLNPFGLERINEKLDESI